MPGHLESFRCWKGKGPNIGESNAEKSSLKPEWMTDHCAPRGRREILRRRFTRAQKVGCDIVNNRVNSYFSWKEAILATIVLML